MQIIINKTLKCIKKQNALKINRIIIKNLKWIAIK